MSARKKGLSPEEIEELATRDSQEVLDNDADNDDENSKSEDLNSQDTKMTNDVEKETSNSQNFDVKKDLVEDENVKLGM